MPKCKVRVVFLDVGQGSSFFIKTPNNKQILVDAGPNKETLRKLSKYMFFWDKKIDILIATHPDSDHIGSFPEIIKYYDFDYFLKNKNIAKTTFYKEVESRLKEKRVFNPKIGDKIYLDDDLYLLFLFPDTDTMESNTSSLVFKLVYKENTVLFTGDSPSKIEKYLVDLFGNSLGVDILSVGHHGSKTSTNEDFLKIVAPQYSVISVGENNRFGYPHEDVLSRLKKWGGLIYRTGMMGDIEFHLDDKNIIVK